MTAKHDTESKVATSLPPELKAKLKAVADNYGITLSAYTRRVLISHLKEKLGVSRVSEILQTKSLTDKNPDPPRKEPEVLGPASTPPRPIRVAS